MTASLFTDTDIQTILTWMRSAGEIALRWRDHFSIHIKPDQTPVTEAEHEIEDLFTANIRARFPGHAVLSEESGASGPSSDTTWVIDPIDGTRPYIWGMASWGVSVGVIHNGEPVAGFFYSPLVEEMHWGWQRGSYCNGRPYPGLEQRRYLDKLVFLAIPSNAHLRYDITYPRIKALGSTAAHLAYLARGHAAGALIRSVYLWDFAPFLCIYEQLGIHIEGYSGAQLDLPTLLTGQATREELLAAPTAWLPELRAQIKRR
jgi:myo-inositol-1(or 4)-monophosphatase